MKWELQLNAESEVIAKVNQQELPTIEVTDVTVEVPPLLQEIQIEEQPAPTTQELQPALPTLEETDKQLPVWTGLKLKLQHGLQNPGKFYHETVSEIGEIIGIGHSEPFWNVYLNRWQVIVNFACGGCKSVPCDWLEAIA